MAISALDKMLGGRSFADKMTLKQKPGQNEGAIHVNVKEKSILRRFNSKCKGPAVQAWVESREYDTAD